MVPPEVVKVTVDPYVPLVEVIDKAAWLAFAKVISVSLELTDK